MAKIQPAEWIRSFHRWSGFGLILFIGAKLLSGFALSGKLHFINEPTADRMHFSKWVDVPLLLFFIFHALYGILKIGMSKGIQHKVRALVLTNIFAGLLFLFTMVVLFR